MTRQNLIPASVDSASPQPPPDVQQQQQMLTVNALIPLWDFCNHQDGKVWLSISSISLSLSLFSSSSPVGVDHHELVSVEEEEKKAVHQEIEKAWTYPCGLNRTTQFIRLMKM